MTSKRLKIYFRNDPVIIDQRMDKGGRKVTILTDTIRKATCRLSYIADIKLGGGDWANIYEMTQDHIAEVVSEA